ncbi:MAG: hypothetical protein ACYS7Y_30095 [Planctomycetota bacterium]|jgi:hypothetical protein
MGFAKLYSIQDSSIMELDVVIRFIFLFLLGEADFNGFFDGSPDSLARRANVPKEDMERALEMFQDTDPDSKSKIEDGRRIIYQGANRWWIVNYVEYRTKQDDGYRKYQWRKRKAKQRALDRGEEWDEITWSREDALDQGLSRDGHGESPHTEAEAEAEADSVGRVSSKSSVPRRSKAVVHSPPSEEEVAEAMIEKGVKDQFVMREARKFIGYYEGQDWRKANGQPLTRWKSAIAYWVNNNPEITKAMAASNDKDKIRAIRRRMDEI